MYQGITLYYFTFTKFYYHLFLVLIYMLVYLYIELVSLYKIPTLPLNFERAILNF